MNEEIREVLAENEAKRNKEQKTEQVINPLDYVTIPIKEYRKLIKKVERVKMQNKQLKELAEVQKKADDYRRWWKEEEQEKDELRKNLDEAKAQIAELLGLQELEKVREVQDA